MNQGSGYHAPVLLQDCVEGLKIRPDGVYVDVTFGGGGHSRAILEQLGDAGALIAFDRDLDAQRNAIDDPRFTLVHGDFRWIRNHLRHLGRLPIDGLLADLGVSSHQFDVAARGFSFRSEGALDMRMDRRAKRTAAQLVAELDDVALTDVLRRYGEVDGAHRVARELVRARGERAITTTTQLVEALRQVTPRREENSFLARVFQALRIAVNDELGSLEVLLRKSAEVIRPGGRLVVMSYHSLEDRMVKNWLRSGDPDGKETKDVFGNLQRPFKPTHSKAMKPGEQEIERNPRARSARLRIGERI